MGAPGGLRHCLPLASSEGLSPTADHLRTLPSVGSGNSCSPAATSRLTTFSMGPGEEPVRDV